MGSFSVLAEEKANERVIRKRYFAWGLVSGVLACLAVSAGALAYVTIRGVTVPMDRRTVAAMVRERVERESRIELPVVMRRLAEDAPKALSGKLESRKGITLRMMDSDIKLPRKVVRELDRRIERKLADALAKAAVEYDTTPLVRIIGGSAYRMVDETLGKELDGKRFPIRLYPWLTVPVTIDAN